MKILFDARYINPENFDGIGRFSQGIGNALAKITPVEFLICDERQKEFLPDNAVFHNFHSPTSPLEPFSALKLNALKPDVFFSPMQTIGLRGKKFPAVLTLHDLIYYSHPKPPQDLPAYVRGIWRAYHQAYFPQRFLLNSADAIVTVSETTKKLMQEHHLTTKPIQVVYNACDEAQLRQRPLSERSKELVYMGSFMPYKNVKTLIQAINALPDYRLRLLSRISPKNQDKLLKLVTTKDQIIFDNGVSDPIYHDILGSAFAAVNASYEEGFGIPLIEAMQQGAPVVCSNIPIFHEIAGNAALFASCDKPEEFVQAIKVLENKKNWELQSQKGIKQSKKFSWEKSAQSLYQLLKSIA
ncbi:MAG: glycosyltransferase family 1 protein [Micrococcaceae bacterium]